MIRKKLWLTSGATAAVVLLAGAGAYWNGWLDERPGRASGDEEASVSSAAPSEEAGAAEADDEAIRERVVPIFDLVRVEPNGDAVIAGMSDPGASVEILAGVEVVARATANDAGEWAIVLDDPLGPGSHDISIRSQGRAGDEPVESRQKIAVAVPEGGEGEVLVVLNEPGRASEIVQLPTAGGETGEDAIEDEALEMAAAPEAVDNDTDSDTGGDTGEAALTAVDGPGDEPTDLAARDEDESVETASNDISARAEAAAVAGAAGEPVGADISEDTAEVAALSQAEPATGPARGHEERSEDRSPAEAGDRDRGGNDVDVRTDGDEAPETASLSAEDGEPVPESEEARSAPAADPVRPAVVVDAVEVEGEAELYVAGSATPGARVRVYIDEEYVGEARAGSEGRWLLESRHAVEPGERRVRADQVTGSEGEVVARAMVPFERIAQQEILVPLSVAGDGEAGGSGGIEAAVRVPEAPNVIIRRGDNLWTIARRLYGRGVRYSTIYEANVDQIRNPNLIYPGQVFITPAGDVGWGDEG